MKRLLFHLFSLFISIFSFRTFTITDCSPSYDAILNEWADSWIEQWSLLPNANDAHTLNYMLNFLYISYERSRATLCVQEAFLPLYEHIHQSIYDVVKRRRNTSKQQEFPHALDSAIDDMARYIAAYTRYHTVMDYHARVSDDVLKNGCLGNDLLTAHAADLHAYTRTVIMCYAGDVKSYMRDMKSLLHTTHDTGGNSLGAARSLLSYLEDSFPSLAFKAFVSIDNSFISATKIAHHLQYDIQASAARVWEAIETARGNFYHMIYKKLYAYVHFQGICGTHLYDIPADLVSLDTHVIPLPQP